MSQEQPRRPEDQAVKYGDIFRLSGDLAGIPVAPKDASMMQAAENLILGQTPKGGPAATMQSAADLNERKGVVGHDDMTDIVGDQGMSVAEADLPGGIHIITEFVGGQVVGRYTKPGPVGVAPPSTARDKPDAVTIGEALEASALTAGDKPVEQSDAAAIQAAEIRATGSNAAQPGGLAATAQSAATHNLRTMRVEEKTKLGEVLADASMKLPADKVVTLLDAHGVVSAEIRNKPDKSPAPGGVAASLEAAARLNEIRERDE